MLNQTKYYLLFFVGCCFLTSCFTGRQYHHPRVRIEPTPQPTELTQFAIPHQKTDTTKAIEKPAEKETLSFDRHQIEIKISSNPSGPKESETKIIQLHFPKKKEVLKKSNDPKRFRFGDALEAVFALLFFLIIGVPSILLLIAGFIMGFFNIMVGFWICWVIGFLGITFATIFYMVIWASTGDKGIGGTFFYLFFFLLAIAFILIVLLI